MRHFYTIIIATFICFTSSFAEVPTMPLSEIKPGMKGIGRTVFRGTTIEEFELVVLDIIENFAPQHDIILVQLMGPKVEKTGVVSGMSGSPIYIDNKLIGALAYSFGIFQKDPIAGITPINSMFKIINRDKVRDKEISSISSINEKFSEYITASPYNNILDNLTQDLIQWNNNSYQLQPIAIPLVFSGINTNVLKTISPTFEKMGFLISQGGTSAINSGDENSTLLPGDAVACVIITGDYNVSSYGTVTHVDGKNVLAFGHPNFNSGPVNMPMAKAKVMTILSSLMQSRKFASMSKIIGTVRQDRQTGIMGIIGENSPMIPIEVVYDSPFDEKIHYNYKLAKDRTLSSIAPVFFWVTLLSTLETARFSNGDYNIDLTGKIVIKNHSDIILDNYYSGTNYNDPPGGGQDIMQVAYDIVMKFMPLLNNHYEFPDIQKIQLYFKARPGKKSLNIENVWYDKSEVKPGDKIDIIVKLKEYQGKTINITKSLVIPSNITSKRVILSVGSAGYMTAWDHRYTPSKFNPQNFDQLTDLINNLKRNNILYIQIKALENGAIISGQELPNLPPTILNIIKERKTSGSSGTLREAVLTEKQILMQYGIHGGKSIHIKVKN